MSPLPKHLRPRYRYLAVGIETWPDTALDRRAFQQATWEAARYLVGDVGSAAADPRVLRFSAEDGAGEAIVRVRRGEESSARAALACVDRVGEHPVGVVVRGIGGTIRACEEKYLGERPEPECRTVEFEGSTLPAISRDDRVDVRTDGAYTGATDLDCEYH